MPSSLILIEARNNGNIGMDPIGLADRWDRHTAPHDIGLYSDPVGSTAN
jgi:hypothetical protein